MLEKERLEKIKNDIPLSCIKAKGDAVLPHDWFDSGCFWDQGEFEKYVDLIGQMLLSYALFMPQVSLYLFFLRLSYTEGKVGWK